MVKIITKKEQIKLDELNYLLGLYDIDLTTLKDIIVERRSIQDETEKMRKIVGKLLKKQDELENRYNNISSNIEAKKENNNEKQKLQKELDDFLNTQEEVKI